MQTRLINLSFRAYNIDGTKNRDITKVAPLEIEINRYKEHIEVAVTDLNGMDIFLGHNWLIKYQDIKFKTRRIQVTETSDKDQ